MSGPSDIEAAAYGLRLPGIAAQPYLAVRGAHSWPPVTIRRVADQRVPLPVGSMSADAATILTPVGVLAVDRAAATVEVRAPAPVDDADIVHPGLWPAAAVFARWRGRETFHAGAFVSPTGGAWAVLGDRGGGKSSLLASLALAGVEVLVDDLTVIDGSDCCAGPRCIDLRPEAAAALGLDRKRAVAVRSTSRRRLALSPCDARRPLAGFIELAWGGDLRVESLAPSAALAALAAHRRIIGLGIDYALMLELVAYPMLRVSRRRDWCDHADAVDAVRRAVGA